MININKVPTIAGYCFKENQKKKICFSFQSLFLALEPLCNFRCPYCYTNSYNISNIKGLSSSEIKKVIIEAKKVGAKSIVVAGEGEPFLSNHIWTVIDTTSQYGMIPVIFTNGSCINLQLAKRLYSTNVSLILKLNSFNPEIQDYLVGVQGAHKMIYNALKALIESGFRSPRFAIQSLISKKNVEDLKEIFLFCRRENIVPYFETFVVTGRALELSVRNNLEPDHNTVIKFFEDIKQLDEELFGFKWQIYPKQRIIGYGACNKNRFMISIASNGNVYRCVTESKILGNIKNDSLGSILSKPENMAELIKNECEGCNSFTF